MRPPARVPGFATAAPARATDTVPAPSQPPSQAPASLSAAGLSRKAGTRPLHLRLVLPLHHRYRQLLRDCEDEGLETSMTELVHALLHGGPTTPDQVRTLIRTWRREVEG
jgi:hypothetical protein